jgi:hypothetical protein
MASGFSGYRMIRDMEGRWKMGEGRWKREAKDRRWKIKTVRRKAREGKDVDSDLLDWAD